MRNRSWLIVLLSVVTTTAGAADPTIQPGLYEIVTRTDMGGAQTARKCLTAADVTKGLQPELAKDCKSIRAVVAGGKLDFATTCPDMSMTMTGSYTPTSYVIDGKVVMKGDDPMTMESHITAKRVSESCKGS